MNLPQVLPQTDEGSPPAAFSRETENVTMENEAKKTGMELTFVCPIPGCGSTIKFTRSSELTAHMHSHVEENPLHTRNTARYVRLDLTEDGTGVLGAGAAFARDSGKQSLVPVTDTSSRSNRTPRIRRPSSRTGSETTNDYFRNIKQLIVSLVTGEGSRVDESLGLLDCELEKPHCLIDTRSLHLVEFGRNRCIPPYAILSHRWGKEEEEVRYQEFKWPTPETFSKAGYREIAAACDEALLHGLHYLWVDTCCINQDDKDVHRNIKSMFAYYQFAHMCYAYLVDVEGNNFRNSVWFTRGWTLQELLAPLDVKFFDRAWECIGHRSERSREIPLITGIPEGVVKGETRIYKVDVEEKMSWSARRETSRPPDQA
ncbi:hypothetical protein D9758_005394 [Tetrapyrgos nigripes]|uniref:Heterokaryon incompatibility domain-containing protein n=1 Tax=Tetrapyrgos nigripes TaxID=182062 RepID=A0A8H5LPX9_9AGAR|nr:hypothetical protein D9758_005394 [Tetrapyrgos nigripes]